MIDNIQTKIFKRNHKKIKETRSAYFIRLQKHAVAFLTGNKKILNVFGFLICWQPNKLYFCHCHNIQNPYSYIHIFSLEEKGKNCWYSSSNQYHLLTSLIGKSLQYIRKCGITFTILNKLHNLRFQQKSFLWFPLPRIHFQSLDLRVAISAS